jgi:ribosomal-protein-alanine N-acetyltransferase
MGMEDLDTVVAMEAAVFPDPWSRESFKEILTEWGWRALVAVGDDQIIGYACWLVAEREAHLTNIAVAVSYRRKSIAKRMLEHILQNVSEAACEYLLLEVRPSNAGAIAFYEKQGFELMYRRPKYYRKPPEDALVLVRYLTVNP